ncbi:MAG: enoyl-CoA hydratase-related protein [Gammaproteobacteria bacterium]
MSDFKCILYRVTDKVAHITLNKPESRNALSLALRAEVVAALKMAERDDDASIVLIDGAGPVFCSGYDLKGYNAPEGGFVSEKLFDTWTDQFARSCIKDWLTIWDLLKPVVCKVQGACLAGGTELMSMCDIVFAADNARLGYPPTRGMSSPDTSFFPWKMSMAQAKYMQLTGASISGRQAAEWGWIAKSFPADRLDAEVAKEVKALSTILPDLLAVNKGALNETYEMMGFKNALNSGVHWHVMSNARVRPNAKLFQKVQAEKGLKEALRWRDEAFNEIDFKG